jgi:hypothetical protein
LQHISGSFLFWEGTEAQAGKDDFTIGTRVLEQGYAQLCVWDIELVRHLITESLEWFDSNTSGICQHHFIPEPS